MKQWGGGFKKKKEEGTRVRKRERREERLKKKEKAGVGWRRAPPKKKGGKGETREGRARYKRERGSKNVFPKERERGGRVQTLGERQRREGRKV